MLSAKALLVFFMVSVSAAQAGQPVTLKDSITRVPRYRNQFGFQFEAGVKSGKANQTPDYRYVPLMLQVEYQKPISSSKNSTWFLDYFIQPQLNFVKYREDIFNRQDAPTVSSWETGVNAGLMVYKSFSRTAVGNKAVVYFLVSSGPHFVSSTPARQSNGFIFSDNWRFGLRVPVNRNLFLDFRGGRRHISNANINPPNGGINNKIAGVGLHYVFF